MWPFKKKPLPSAILDDLRFERDVPSSPPISPDKVREAHQRELPGPVAFQGPFPLCDPQGRFLCKSCGVAFDEWNIAQAVGSLRAALTDPSAGFGLYVVNCRKCSSYSCFSPKDVMTGHTGDPLAAWTKSEIRIAKMGLTMLMNLSPAEVAAISPDHLAKVLFLYR